MNFSTSCTILVTFGPETPEFTTLTIAPFAVIWQKAGYTLAFATLSSFFLNLLILTLALLVGANLFGGVRLRPWQSSVQSRTYANN